MRWSIPAKVATVFGISLHCAAAFAQLDDVVGCQSAVLYDSSDGLFRLEPGAGTPQLVYTNFAGPGTGASKPHLSPDRRTLAWVRFIPESEEGPAIWLTDLSDRSSRPLVSGMNSDQPAWSPNGEQLVFTSWRPGSDGLIGDLYVVGADGENLKRLTNDEVRNEFATWSPDGAMEVAHSE